MTLPFSPVLITTESASDASNTQGAILRRDQPPEGRRRHTNPYAYKPTPLTLSEASGTPRLATPQGRHHLRFERKTHPARMMSLQGRRGSHLDSHREVEARGTPTAARGPMAITPPLRTSMGFVEVVLKCWIRNGLY
jgi:hypothetical protein